MSASGFLVHIASSSLQGENLVLDVNQPLNRRRFAEGGHAPLVITWTNSHRVSTQTWEFTEVCVIFVTSMMHMAYIHGSDGVHCLLVILVLWVIVVT